MSSIAEDAVSPAATVQVRPADSEYEAIAGRFRPVFARIAAGTLERERSEVAEKDAIGWLAAAGFARLRHPDSLGGERVPLSTVFRLLAELAEADPNIAHVWRNHFSFVEDRLSVPRDAAARQILDHLGRGEIVGGGWSETDNTSAADVSTTVRRGADGLWRVSGVKHYSTGSIYATWFTVLGLDEEGDKRIALVDAASDGVEVLDNWDGFGQRLTGSGGVRYTDVVVPEERVLRYADRYPYQGEYYQTTMHAVLVGIGRAVLRDGIAALHARTRSHRNGTTDDPRHDPQVLEAIGGVAGQVFAAESAFAASLAPIDALVEAHENGGYVPDAALPAYIAVATAQAVIIDSVLDAATTVFDALGASGTGRAFALDRHWRNARTLASHNPRIFKKRIVGDFLVNGRVPDGVGSPVAVAHTVG